VSALRIVDDEILLDGEPVALLLPNLRPTLLYRLVEAFDAIDEDAETIADLEGRIAELEEQLKQVRANAFEHGFKAQKTATDDEEGPQEPKGPSKGEIADKVGPSQGAEA
jgi:hypothetical protein